MNVVEFLSYEFDVPEERVSEIMNESLEVVKTASDIVNVAGGRTLLEVRVKADELIAEKYSGSEKWVALTVVDGFFLVKTLRELRKAGIELPDSTGDVTYVIFLSAYDTSEGSELKPDWDKIRKIYGVSKEEVERAIEEHNNISEKFESVADAKEELKNAPEFTRYIATLVAIATYYVSRDKHGD